MFQSLNDLWQQSLKVWSDGGWAMLAIATIALVMFGTGMRILLALSGKRISAVPEDTWRTWIDNPEERRGTIGRLLDVVTRGKDLKDTVALFSELRHAEIGRFERDLKVMKACISCAPLVGLLGTVGGMLTTFGALATGSGGDQTMGHIAAGISEALITTETGLVVALPGLFVQYQLSRKNERYKAFLAHLETVCTQTLYRNERREDEERVRRAAQLQVARQLSRRLRAAAS